MIVTGFLVGLWKGFVSKLKSSPFSLSIWSSHSTGAKGGQGGRLSGVEVGADSFGSVEGGAGGTARNGVVGGKGGGAEARGSFGIVYLEGGTGGCAATNDGRGGLGARGQVELQGGPTALWHLGAGGAGCNSAEYNRRLKILEEIQRDYFDKFPDRSIFIKLGIDLMPIRWINTQLSEREETWSVCRKESGEIEMPRAVGI